MLKEKIVSINQRGKATSTWEINTCIQKWSSHMNRMIKSGKCMLLVPLPKSNIIRHVLLRQKRKGGDKACILLHIDRNRQSSTVPTPHHRRPPLKQKPKAHVPFYNSQDHQVRGTRNLRNIQKPCLVTFTNLVLLPLQCLYIGLPLQAFPVNKASWFLI
jgi:hypothetical protein